MVMRAKDELREKQRQMQQLSQQQQPQVVAPQVGRLRYTYLLLSIIYHCLQCFDAVG